MGIHLLLDYVEAARAAAPTCLQGNVVMTGAEDADVPAFAARLALAVHHDLVVEDCVATLCGEPW